MKMEFSSTFFNAIAFCLVSILAKSFGELIVLRHPLSDDNYERKLTCIAKDDDSALIWNYNPNENLRQGGQNNLPAFKPDRASPKHIAPCSVWAPKKCIALKWDQSSGWEAVNSIIRPMAPVFDRRWEGFKEFAFKEVIEKQEYVYVDKVEDSSGTVVLSARGLNHIHVFLCKTVQRIKGPCIWILLSKWHNSKSEIRLCADGAPDTSQASRRGICTDLAQSQYGSSKYLDAYEWRTFILKWNSTERSIKVFTNDDTEPFLYATNSTWENVPYIFIRGERPSRIRFHFYEYFFAELKDTELRTTEFYDYRKIVKFKLFVGLCRDCELTILLIDNENQQIIREIVRNEISVTNELLAWQSVELTPNFENVNSRSVRLIIRTFLVNEKEKGRWAIDSFRTYETTDGTRESTLTIRREEDGKGSYLPNWGRVKCQKLSHPKSAVVDPFSTSKFNDTSQLGGFLLERKGTCDPDCTHFGPSWFICDQTGCTCDRGFDGADCTTQCTDGYYEYNCNKRCESCNTGICNKATGQCGDGSNDSQFQPRLCKREILIQGPFVTYINDTTVRVSQPLECVAGATVTVSYTLTNTKYNTLQDPLQDTLNATLRSIFYVRFKNLELNTEYKLHTIVHASLGNWKEQLPGNEILFRTTCMGKHRFEVLPGKNTVTVTRLFRDKACEDPDQLIKKVTVTPSINGEIICKRLTSSFSYICSHLSPNTEYMIKIELYDFTSSTKKFQTLQSAPDIPLALTTSLKDNGIVNLTWTYPAYKTTSIKLFRVFIVRLETKLQTIPSIANTTEKDYPVTKQEMSYSMELELLTSTEYNISVVAVTQDNMKSAESRTKIRVPAGISFESGKKLKIKQSGTLIELKVPKVINATTNTTVSIFIKELSAQAQNQSQTSSSFVNKGWVAVEYTVMKGKSKPVRIDGNHKGDVTSNFSLKIGATYEILAIVKDLYSNKSAELPPSTITLMDVKQNLIWLIIFPIIAMCLLLLFMWHRKHKKSQEQREDIVPLSLTKKNTGTSRAPQNLDRSTTLPKPTEDEISIRQSTPDVVPYNPHSYSVQFKEFEEYTREAIASGLLGSQYEAMATGHTKACEYGKMPENLFKNRYKNLVPYDDTRVILKKIPGDPHSDYINASYITGYRKERAYIATQGPLPNTMNDFWRMVWQEKVNVICMLTNVTENGMKKCEQYWPMVGTGMKYGNIYVSNTDHEVFADYTIRTLNLSYENKDRKVTHLHYTGWPDHGVPMYSQSLVAYLKKLLATPTGNGPVVVHCSAGIGRTGTIILCEICLRQAVRERTLDVASVTARMREDRSDMVNSIQQYMLAHLAIMESIVYEQTQVPCSHGLPKKIKELRKHLPFDIQRLTDSVWQDRALHSFATTRRSVLGDVSTSRLSEFVPAEFNRNSTFDSESNYINAVSVDGVKMKEQYLESQLPSPLTLSEYWRLIAEKKIELVLILQKPSPNDPMCCEIMTNDSILNPVPYIQVEVKSSVDEEEHFTTQRLLMTDKSRKRRQQPVTVLKCTGWESGKDGQPPSPEALVSLWMASEKISRKEAPTLVLCHDGVTGCGLYLALSFLLERMAVERECDVISAVRAVRRSRTEFVQSLVQFDYLYDAALNFFECFQTYANFS